MMLRHYQQYSVLLWRLYIEQDMPIRLKHLATAPFDFVFNWQNIAISTVFFLVFFFYINSSFTW